MKRNETVLVYTVTGLLVVILGIAVIFGEDANASRDLKDDKIVKGEGDLGIMDDNVPGVGNVVAKKQPEKAGSEQSGSGPEKEPEKKADQPEQGKPEEVVKPVALVSKKSAAEEIALRFGASSREGLYREVKSRPGDRLTTVMRRWCGTADKELLADLEGMNELYRDGKPMPAGTKVIVPWIDDADLLKKHETLKAAPVVINQPASVTIYTVQPGDNLWKIAVKRVGAKKAPAYIQKIAQANPEIENLDFLREKQKLRLPH